MGIFDKVLGDKGIVEAVLGDEEQRAERKAARDEAQAEREAMRSAQAAAAAEQEKLLRSGAVMPEKNGRALATLPIKLTAHAEVYRYIICVTEGGKGNRVHLANVQSIQLEDGEALQARVTATRLLLVGVFAFAFKKKRGGQRFLVVETDDSLLTLEVPRDKINEATRFVQAARGAMKTLAAERAADEA